MNPGALSGVVRGEFGLVPDALAEIRGLLSRTPGVVRAWVFGSRARDDWRPRSDLDLAIDAPGWAAVDLLRLHDAMRHLPMVYRVDLVHLQSAEPALAAQIARDRKLLWEIPSQMQMASTRPRAGAAERSA